MAIRPVFTMTTQPPFFERKDIEFNYCSGFSLSQKQKSIANLHEAFRNKFPEYNILEVSSKSNTPIGKSLSAFNLKMVLKNGDRVSIESAFQSSKVFENGKQYVDLLFKKPFEAKKDERLRTSGNVEGFIFQDESFPTEPKTLFYNWLYINALIQNPRLGEELTEYSAFTDIEFNPKKSINCQAISTAIYVSLVKCNKLNDSIQNVGSFKKTVFGNQMIFEQLTLF